MSTLADRLAQLRASDLPYPVVLHVRPHCPRCDSELEAPPRDVTLTQCPVCREAFHVVAAHPRDLTSRAGVRAFPGPVVLAAVDRDAVALLRPDSARWAAGVLGDLEVRRAAQRTQRRLTDDVEPLEDDEQLLRLAADKFARAAEGVA